MEQSTDFRPSVNTHRGTKTSVWSWVRDILVRDAYAALNAQVIPFEIEAVKERMALAVQIHDLPVISEYDLVTGGVRRSTVVTFEQVEQIIETASAKVMDKWDPTYRKARALAASTKYDLLRFEKIAHLTIAQQVEITGMSPRAVSYMRKKVKNLADPQVRALHEKAVEIRARWERRRKQFALMRKRRASALASKAREQRLRHAAFSRRGHGLFAGIEKFKERWAARDALLAEMFPEALST